MNSFASLSAAEGVPAAVLAAALRRAGKAVRGGARFTAALASIGPGGMVGGLVTIAVVQAVSYLITDKAVELTLTDLVRQKVKNGMPVERIADSIDKYPVTSDLKEKLKRKAVTLPEKELASAAGSNTLRIHTGNVAQKERRYWNSMSPRRKKQLPLGSDDGEDDSQRLNVYDAALIWASNGKDEDYTFGYTEEELEEALEA